MNGCINSFIQSHKFIHWIKSPKYGWQLHQEIYKLDCEKSVNESAQGEINMTWNLSAIQGYQMFACHLRVMETRIVMYNRSSRHWADFRSWSPAEFCN